MQPNVQEKDYTPPSSNESTPNEIVAGDKIVVGDIAESKNIAIGKDIQQTIYEGYSAEEVALIVAETRKADDAAPSVEIPPPPEPTKPPEVLGFVGRDEELTYFAEMLRTENLAVIAGMAGVGKTALASTLIGDVMREPSRVLWHSFHEEEGVDAVLWSLAGFLAWHGKDDLWKLLQSARLTGGQPPPPETIFDYILQLVRDGDYLLCFDDFHHVDGDPVFNKLVERLREALNAGHLSIIITSRRVPDFVTISQVDPVDGLTAQDTQRLLQTQGVALTQEQSDQLYASTAGNAEFLILAIDALQNARNPEDLLEQLAATDDIERYLISEVDDALTGQERGVMNALAALLGYAATRDAVEAVVDRGNVFRTLRGLAERHLLIVQETDAGRTYRQHDLVRDFYYEMCSRRERKKLHALAGEFYRDDEEDLLQAGIHYERAGVVEEAAQLVSGNVLEIINLGRANVLKNLLKRFEEKKLEIGLWLDSRVALAQIHMLHGEREAAEQLYATVLELLPQVADEKSRAEFEAQACHDMGELLQNDSPTEARDWLMRGLEKISAIETDSKLVSAIPIRLGYVEMSIGNYEAAKQHVNDGLDLLPPGDSSRRSFALMQLGSIQSELGAVDEGLAYTHKALAISERMHDHFRSLGLLINLAIDEFATGNWEVAFKHFEQALALADQTGRRQSVPKVKASLAQAHICLGNHLLAEQYLSEALELAVKYGQTFFELHCYSLQADLYFRKSNTLRAHESILRAESLATKLDVRSYMPDISLHQASIDLAQGDESSALTNAEKAAAVAMATGQMLEAGKSFSLLGQIYRESGDRDRALIAFEKSNQLLNGRDPYYAARNNAQWGMTLVIYNEHEKGEALVFNAYQTFRNLGAQLDLQEIQKFCQKCNLIFSVTSS